MAIKETEMKEPEIPSEFKKLSRKPMSTSYSTGRSYRLERTREDTLRVKRTAFTTILALSGILISLVFAVTIYNTIIEYFHKSWEMGLGISCFVFVVLLAFGGGGISLLWISSLKNEFDLNSSRYRNKEVNIDQWLKITEYDLPFSDIRALQVLKKESHDSESDIICYELNLVFKDLKRINVIPHGTIEGIREDAELVTEYLDIPIIQQS